jgi:hypothetical protein
MSLFEGPSAIGLLLAVALPWLAGALAVHATAGRQAGMAAVIGFGFFVGQLFVIALLLAWDAAGLALSFAPPAVLLAAACAGLAWRAARPPRPMRRPPPPRWRGLTTLAVGLLLALIASRFGLMASEVIARPVFAWDAWMNWVPRAIVWFDHDQLTPFVLPPEWLAAPASEEVYTLGNWRASGYPPGVPLMLLWTMLGAGTADHTLLFLPWLLAPVAFSLVLWEQLYRAGTGTLVALLAVYAFISPPLVATHVMLVGYADLWLALYFSLGVIAVDRMHRGGGVPVALLALAMAAGTVLMKTPGLVFGAVIVLLLALAALGLPDHWWRRLSLAGLAGIVALLLAGLLGGDAQAVLPLPMFLPDLRLQPQPLLPILAESMLVFGNWHLLWPLLALAAVAALAVRGRAALAGPAIAGWVAAAGLLVFVFGFTHYFRQAENLVTLNRALLYLVPLSAYLVGCWLDDARGGREYHDR